MKIELIQLYQGFEKLADELGGVFSCAELETLINLSSRASFFRAVKDLQRIGAISKFKRSLYIAKRFNPFLLSARIDPKSYISMDTVLARNGLIGTVPALQVSAVRVGRNRTYVTDKLVIKHFGITSRLYFGFAVVDGIKFADNEKAYIDMLYYQMKGARFAFNPASDVDVSRLDMRKLNSYLRSYRNKRFVTYVRDLANGQ